MEQAPALSCIVPFYKKLTELRAVLPFNARTMKRADVELVLVLDEPSQEEGVLALLDTMPWLQARVIVNDRPHEWRTPCVAINVGLRAAAGRFVFVASPESLFVGDVPSRVLEVLSQRPSDVLLGRVAWATFKEAHRKKAAPLFAAAVEARGGLGFSADYYGSIAAARDLFFAVGGYDESLSEWGGDDDNMRARLSLHGALLILDRKLRLLHLSTEKPVRNRSPAVKAPQAKRAIINPRRAKANADDWGLEFGRVARDWREPGGVPRASPAALDQSVSPS